MVDDPNNVLIHYFDNVETARAFFRREDLRDHEVLRRWATGPRPRASSGRSNPVRAAMSLIGTWNVRQGPSGGASSETPGAGNIPQGELAQVAGQRCPKRGNDPPNFVLSLPPCFGICS
jgi:hypothetical protein